MKKLLLSLAALILTAHFAFGNFASFQAASSATCAAGTLDTFAASPGAWTAAYSLRKLKTTSTNAIQLQRSSDSTTLDIGFTGCNPNVVASTAFCSTATLAAGTTASANVAFPSGTVIHVFNQGPNAVFYASGNGSVTATTASTPLPSKQGVNITVGANTNLAAIIGTGFGLNGGAGSATLWLTNCGASKVYDQSGNGFDQAPATVGLVNQMGYIPTGVGPYSALFGCLSGCAYKATDNATYKTTTVNTFVVQTFGEDITTANFYYPTIGYPNTTSSNAGDFRWGLINTNQADQLVPIVNSSPFTIDPEGFGGVWRGQNLTQFDYNASSSNISIRWNGGTSFFTTGTGATPTYPNAVGLYMMGDAAGNSTPGIWTEALVASGTQTARDSISANQVSFWAITTGTASSVALTNPLGDGFNWNQAQIGSFAPNPPGPGAYTINGNTWSTESSWNDYTQWQCSNCSSVGGRLGDLWRFQVTSFDVWDGTNRSELDGAGGSAQFNNGTTYWISYAVLVEPGTSYTASWNIVGQMHAAGSAPICCVFNINYKNDQFIINTDNTNTAAETTRYTSPTITRNQYNHFVFKVFVSTTGTTDTFDAWFDPVTPGTMSHVVALTSGSYFGGNANSTLSYWKFGDYRETAAIKPTFAIRYGNMQACAQGSGCTSLYGASDLSAQTTTPLPDPAHTNLGKLLLVNGVDRLLLSDGVSKLCLSDGC